MLQKEVADRLSRRQDDGLRNPGGPGRPAGGRRTASDAATRRVSSSPESDLCGGPSSVPGAPAADPGDLATFERVVRACFCSAGRPSLTRLGPWPHPSAGRHRKSH
jgi:hypothetical protein